VHYDLGSALARAGKLVENDNPETALELYRRSVESFKRTLAVEPGRDAAAINVEVVRSWMKSLLDKGIPKQASDQQSSGTGSQGGSSGGQSGQPRAAPPGQQPVAPAAPEGPAASGVPKEETAQSILQEERDRRAAEAKERGGEESHGSPNW
jgi:hypothetical protein